MSLSKKFLPWGVKLHTKTAQSGGAVYVETQSQGLNSQLQTRLSGPAGAVYRTFGALVSGAPVLRFSSRDLKAFLDECGAEGMLIDADGSHPGVVPYWQKIAQGGTRVAADGSVHISETIANGILVPRTVSIDHQGTAVLSAEALARKESTTAPVVSSETADLPDGVDPAADAEWGMGPIDLNGTDFDGLRNMQLDFGIEVAVESSGGDLYPTLTYIGAIMPVITASGLHIDALSTLTEDGKYYAAETVIAYLRKKDEGGSYVADGTAQHIGFTLGKCRVDWEEIGDEMINVRVTPWRTPGVSPVASLAINTATAIS